MLTAVAIEGKAPYKTVISHGWVVDGEGRKMSKSLGNGINPDDIVKQYGAEILRLWVASSDYHADIRISPKFSGSSRKDIVKYAILPGLFSDVSVISILIGIWFRMKILRVLTVGR